MKKICLLFICWLCLGLGGPVQAYSVLTHEAIIDVNWKDVIVPLLKQRFPAASDSVIEEARAFAYGGAIAPDMGYYPFGNTFFSDLIHYVRNGAFVTALQEDAQDVKEYAFALGFLSHYHADQYGHALGVNPAVPLVFPEARQEHGPVVTYHQEPTMHIRTEFGFDVLQTARGNYVPDAYQRFISFEMADDLLKRSFRRSYNLEVDSIFTNYPRSVRTFRWAVKDIFPQLTRAAWRSKRKEIQAQQQTATARNFRYRMQRKTFVAAYGKEIEQPGLGARMIALLIRILPKVGPLKPLRVVVPGPEAEKLFVKSFDTVSTRYQQALRKLQAGQRLPNVDFDTGSPAAHGEYQLADETYFKYLVMMKERKYANMDAGLKKDLVSFYASRAKAGHAQTTPGQWNEIQQMLKQMMAAATP